MCLDGCLVAVGILKCNAGTIGVVQHQVINKKYLIIFNCVCWYIKCVVYPDLLCGVCSQLNSNIWFSPISNHVTAVFFLHCISYSLQLSLELCIGRGLL